MKQKVLILVILMVMFLMPITISAKTDLLLDCKSMSCSMSVSTDEKINSFAAKIQLPKGLEISNITKDNGWNGQVEDTFITVYSDGDKTGDIDIATFDLKSNGSVNDSLTINITDISYSDANYNEHTINNVTEKITISKGNSNSSNIILPIGIAVVIVIVIGTVIVTKKKRK